MAPSPRASDSAGRLNPAQSQRVRSSFARVDELLASVQRALGAPPERSPFSREIPDATPLQRKIAADCAARARALMAAGLQRLGIASAAPEVSAVWSARVALRSAQIAVAEAGPADLRGYGALAEDAARELSGVIGPLLEVLEQMESLLAQGAGTQLEARLRRLDAFPDERRLIAETARIVSERGLAQFRASLEALAERADTPQVEIALFGRNNAGKSSLLNFLLGESVLPVGPTPVTAVAVRIAHGPRREGRVWFADAAAQIFSLDRLAEFARQTQNPDNARHVSRLELRLPVPLLERGVCLVDSPGYGALSSAPDDSALAYVPRCDLGILAIDASSPPGVEDALVLDRLLRSGAAVMVVLTKADTLGDRDALHALVHARRQLAAETGSEVPVHLVSVKGKAAEYARRWLKSDLAPRVDEGLALRQRSLRRKAVALACEVAGALERRLSAAQDPAQGHAGQPRADATLRDAWRAIEFAHAARPEPLCTPRVVQDCLAEAAYNAALVLQREPRFPNDLTPVLAASARSREKVAADAAAREIGKLRAVLQNALAEAAAGELEREDDALPRPSGLPLPAAEIPPACLLIKRKPLLLGIRFLLERSLRRRMARGAIAALLADLFGRYERSLQAWRAEQIELLRAAFAARAGRLHAPADPAAEVQAQRTGLERDLRRLRSLLGDLTEHKAVS